MEKVSKEVNEALTALQTLFSNFNDHQFNVIPFDGSWTAGQIAKHMVLVNGGFMDMINGPVAETSRPADQIVPQIKADFENFNIRMEAPDIIVPPFKDYDKQRLMEKLDQIRQGIIQAVDKLDLTKTTTAWELPGYGYLTRLEAAYFVAYHAKRHNRQLTNIYNKLINN
nr:DinB family protein [Pedobacter sp. ASV2]